MTNYYFETREFGISDDGIHRLRSRFNYETISFDQIVSLTIDRGKELNNWLVILLIGLAFVSFSIYYSFGLFRIFESNQLNVIYIEEILLPLIPFMLGGYCLYASTKNGTILRIRTRENKAYKFPLSDVEKDNKIQDFTDFVKARLNTKVSVLIQPSNN